MALYFAAGLSDFTGSEPGWLSQNWNHALNSNRLEDSRKIIKRKSNSQVKCDKNAIWSTSKAFFHVNASNIAGRKSWHVMIFAFLKTDLFLPWERRKTTMERWQWNNGAECSIFQVVCTLLYNPLCWAVCLSFGLSICWSVHLLVSLSVGPSIH